MLVRDLQRLVVVGARLGIHGGVVMRTAALDMIFAGVRLNADRFVQALDRAAVVAALFVHERLGVSILATAGIELGAGFEIDERVGVALAPHVERAALGIVGMRNGRGLDRRGQIGLGAVVLLQGFVDLGALAQHDAGVPIALALAVEIGRVKLDGALVIARRFGLSALVQHDADRTVRRDRRQDFQPRWHRRPHHGDRAEHDDHKDRRDDEPNSGGHDGAPVCGAGP